MYVELQYPIGGNEDKGLHIIFLNQLLSLLTFGFNLCMNFVMGTTIMQNISQNISKIELTHWKVNIVGVLWRVGMLKII
jgi:hypothetical protein